MNDPGFEFDLSVVREDAGRLEIEWRVAGLHPECYGVGCGTADFVFPNEAERQEATRIAGDSALEHFDPPRRNEAAEGESQ